MNVDRTTIEDLTMDFVKRLTDLYKENNLAFWISLCYVGLGTLTILSIYPKDALYGNWVLVSSLITLPVTFLSFGYRYAQSEPLYPVFIIQSVMFVLTFWVFKSWATKGRNRQKRH